MLYAIVAVIILILDQLTKYWTINNLAENATAPLIPGIVQLTHIQNTGAAFGFLPTGRWFFVILTLVVTIGVIVLLSKDIVKGKLGRWMLVMVIAGGLGNCIDRLFYGYVVDMFQLQFMNFAVFNVSDIFITVCGITFCIYLIFHREPVEEKPAPSKMPPRQMPAERPVKTDYITQLKKPVVEGRKNIEAEIAAKAAAQASRNPEGVITDWNIPEDFTAQKDSAEKNLPQRPKPAATDYGALFKEPATPSAPEAKPEPNPEARPVSAAAGPDASAKEPPKPAKKDDEFSLEDIIAEFKD